LKARALRRYRSFAPCHPKARALNINFPPLSALCLAIATKPKGL
jgi:hypothetical protein